MFKNKKAFTLVETMIVLVAVSLLSGVIYKLMTGSFSQFFKSQTKLTNLRSASIILEQLKKDIRLAVVPMDDSEKPEIVTTPGATSLSFHILSDNTRKQVKYTFENNMVYRQLEGANRKPVTQIKVEDFIIDKSDEPDNEFLAFRIIVDKDKDIEGRNQASKGNRVEVKAHLYPGFAASALSDEERYWNLARQAAGGLTP